MTRKLLTALLCLLLLLSGCNTEKPVKKNTTLVTTIFPLYDWAREVLGDNPADLQLILLMDSGSDLHNYQPTTQDIMTINGCELFIYVGGESDKWVKNILKQTTGSLTDLNLLERLGNMALEEDDETIAHKEEEEEETADEHIWLSLRNAEFLCKVICEEISKTDPDNRSLYERNTAEYIRKLQQLDEQYEETVRNGGHDTLLFADRFPFRYLMNDYGLHYYAAFSGCSAETEASFETVAFLINKVNELQLDAIMVLENNDGRMAETIRKSSITQDQQILTLNSLQSVTKNDIASGVTYLQIMQNNLEVLKKALERTRQ